MATMGKSPRFIEGDGLPPLPGDRVRKLVIEVEVTPGSGSFAVVMPIGRILDGAPEGSVFGSIVELN